MGEGIAHPAARESTRDGGWTSRSRSTPAPARTGMEADAWGCRTARFVIFTFRAISDNIRFRQNTAVSYAWGTPSLDPRRFRSSPAGRILRAPSGYWAFVPNPLPPPIRWTDSLAASLSRADRLLGELAGVGRTMANPNLLIVPFVCKEAVLSSAIEGTQAPVSA